MENLFSTNSDAFNALHVVLVKAGILPANCIGFSIHARVNDVVRVECDYYPTEEQIRLLNDSQGPPAQKADIVEMGADELDKLTEALLTRMKQKGI